MTERFGAAAVLVKAIAAINILGNFLGAVLTFVFFCVLEPRLSSDPALGGEGFWDRAMIFAVVVGSAIAIIAPINTRMIIPLYRAVKRSFGTLSSGGNSSNELTGLRQIAGKLLCLPAKLAATTLAGWCIATLAVSVIAHAFPEFFPWPHHSSHKISAWMILVGAPITITWVYFAQETWLRLKIPRMLPTEALLAVPPTYRINALPKLMSTFLLMSILPVAVVSHITIHQIHEIHAGRISIETFLDVVPGIIAFLLATFSGVAIALSIVVSKSFSVPLRHLESAMDSVGEGNLDVRVPVVSNDEIGQMGEGFNRMVRDQKELDSIKDTFGRYVSREVVAEILKSPGGMDLEGEIREITVLVADLRGFTGVAEALHPRTVLQLINRFLQRMTDVILSHEGTIDEFTGDGILVFFGAPRVLADHSLRAVTCAMDMQRAITELNAENLKLGFPELEMGIGVNSGELIIGNIGSEKRKKYGAVGSAINIAFRIEAQTRGGEILVSPAVHDNIAPSVEIKESRQVSLKGLETPITLHLVQGIPSTAYSPEC
jgi:adenylate cyclase